MSLTAALKKAVFAAPIVFALAASNANAQNKLQVIEPNATDLSKPVEGCVQTTPDLKAWDKLVTVMSARSQMIVANGDKLVVGGKQEMMFTISNNFTGKEGYIISSSSPKAERSISERFCFRPTANAAFVDNSRLDKIPSIVSEGELGIALNNNHKLGSKVAVMGMYSQGSLYVVHFNPQTGKGAYKESDGHGGSARDLAVFENFDYTQKMKTVMEQLAKTKDNTQIALAHSPAP